MCFDYSEHLCGSTQHLEVQHVFMTMKIHQLLYRSDLNGAAQIAWCSTLTVLSYLGGNKA